MAAVIAVLGYFTWRMKGTPLVAAGLPVVFAMRESMFFPAWTFSLNLRYLPESLKWNDITFLLLLFAVLVARSRHNRFVRLRYDWTWISIVLYMLLLLFHIPLSWYFDVTLKPGVFLAARRFLIFPFSIFLWIDLFRRGSKEDMMRLLRTTVVVTIIMSLLYSISAAGVTIYPSSPYQTIAFGQGRIIRDFITIPAWISVGLAYLVVERRLASLFLIFPLIAAYFFSYTRTLIFAMLGVFILGAFMPLFRRERGGGFYKVLFSILFAMFVLFVVTDTFFKTNLDFLGHRFEEVRDMGMETGNLAARISTTRMLSARLSGENAVFGVGLSPSGELVRADLPSVLDDSLWNRILYQFGWTGTLVFALMLLMVLVMSLRLALRERGRLGLGLILLLAMTHMLLMAFSSSSILSDTPFVATFLIALVVVEEQNLWPRTQLLFPEDESEPALSPTSGGR